MKKDGTIGLYWGRFNPPHKGHLQLIKKILREVDRITIAIGSSEFKNTKRNPFNGKERKVMMEAYCKEQEIGAKRLRMIPVPDGKSFSRSIDNLFASCSPFDVLYTDKETIRRLIGKRVKVQRIERKGTISSTKIRDAIAKGARWEHLTGKSVARLIKKFGGIERIQGAYSDAAYCEGSVHPNEKS